MDLQGEVLHQWRVILSGRRLAWTPLQEISPVVTSVLLATEDRRFYRHFGVDWLALAAAARSWWRSGFKRGASTLTMQLAALLDPSLQPGSRHHRTLAQKWRQMQAALALERHWSKEQILEAYLNLASFRGEIQGIRAASMGLFDKLPSGVNLDEALLLATLVRLPNAKAATVVERACALAERIAPDRPCAEIREQAERLFSANTPAVRLQAEWAFHAAQRLMESAGSEAVAPRVVHSTLDGPLQRFALQALDQQLNRLEAQNVGNGAVLVVDNAQGAVLAYVGNGDKHPESRQVDGVQALRQAGSTLKPFLYQLALERRLLTSASLLEDAPIDIPTPTGVYAPQNYDRDFKGWVSVRTALASSLNVPAVRTLLLLGVHPFMERLQRLGYTLRTDQEAYYGYALALGSMEVSLWQQVAAYRALANHGRYSPLTMVPTDALPKADPVLEARAAFLVTDILADPVARLPTFGMDSALATPFWSAVKTGTSKQMRDNWCIGYSERYTVGVWVGNFDGSPMRNVSGVSGAAPLWQELMSYLHANGDSGSSPPDAPPGVVKVHTTFSPPMEPARQEWFLAGTEMAQVVLTPNSVRPSRILYPPEGSIVAWDPDIPPERQRLFLRMEPDNPQLQWRMDGQPVAAQDWRLSNGSHRLELVANDGRVVDAVSFQVRGRPGDG